MNAAVMHAEEHDIGCCYVCDRELGDDACSLDLSYMPATCPECWATFLPAFFLQHVPYTLIH